jgi:hypothetical protein
MVRARSAALMPVVMPLAASTLTWKSVRKFSVFCATICSMPNCFSRSKVVGTQISPRPCLAMKLMSGRDAFGGHDQIAFIFPVGIIHHHHHAALAQIGHDRFNRVKLLFHAARKAIVINLFHMLQTTAIGIQPSVLNRICPAAFYSFQLRSWKLIKEIKIIQNNRVLSRIILEINDLHKLRSIDVDLNHV